MRAMWEVVKRFPNLPPFGPAWFGVLTETQHPLAALRLMWILHNVWQDRDERVEQRYREVEYGGMFSNPELWHRMDEARKKEKGEIPATEQDGIVMEGSGLKITQDVSPFWQQYRQAVDGTLDMGQPDADLLDALEAAKQNAPVARPRGIVDDTDGGIVDMTPGPRGR